MASPLITKIGLVSGGAVALTGLGTAAYFSTRISIGDKLLKEGFNLISADDDYKFVLFTHKDATDLKTEILETTITYDKAEHINKIKDWCEKKTKEWFSNKEDKLFLNSKAWCTAPKVKTFGDKFKGRNLHPKEAWDSKFTEFAGKEDIGTKFLSALNVGLSGDALLTKQSPKAGDKLQKWCDSSLKLKIYEKDEHKTEDNIKAWCLAG